MADKPEITFFEEEAQEVVHDLDIDHPGEVPVDTKQPFRHIPTDLEEK